MPKNEVRVAVRKKVNEFDKLIRERYIENIENYYIPTIIDIILQEYDVELSGRVTDRKSRTNPIFYREEFEEALKRFDYIEKSTDKTIFRTPETDTFNWRQGRLRIIENILEGTIGSFIEVDGEQYVSMYGKPPTIQPFDKTVPRKERIYTLRYSGDVRRRWQTTFPNGNIVNYPFSNQPPIDIFDEANKYVEENMRGWIDDAIRQAQKEIVK